MPRYVPDPSKTSFGIPVMQKGNYRIALSGAKAFEKKPTDKNPSHNWGIRYGSKVIASDDHPDKVGKNFGPITLYLHTEGAESYSKGVYAAVVGAKTDDEFNENYADADFSYNTDDGSVGQFWKDLEGKIVDVICDEPTIDEKTNKTSTNIVRWVVAE